MLLNNMINYPIKVITLLLVSMIIGSCTLDPTTEDITPDQSISGIVFTDVRPYALEDNTFAVSWINPKTPSHTIKNVNVSVRGYDIFGDGGVEPQEAKEGYDYEGNSRRQVANFKGLANGLFYEFILSAILEDGRVVTNVAAYAEGFNRVEGIAPPLNIGNLRVNPVNNGRFVITWTNPENPVAPISHINITASGYADADGTGSPLDMNSHIYVYGGNGKNQGAVISNLNSSLFYEFTLTPIFVNGQPNSGGDSSVSSITRVRHDYRPYDVSDVEVNPSQTNGTVILVWNNPENPPQPIINITVTARGYENADGNASGNEEVIHNSTMTFKYGGNGKSQAEFFSGLNSTLYYEFTFDAIVQDPDAPNAPNAIVGDANQGIGRTPRIAPPTRVIGPTNDVTVIVGNSSATPPDNRQQAYDVKAIAIAPGTFIISWRNPENPDPKIDYIEITPHRAVRTINNFNGETIAISRIPLKEDFSYDGDNSSQVEIVSGLDTFPFYGFSITTVDDSNTDTESDVTKPRIRFEDTTVRPEVEITNLAVNPISAGTFVLSWDNPASIPAEGIRNMTITATGYDDEVEGVSQGSDAFTFNYDNGIISQTQIIASLENDLYYEFNFSIALTTGRVIDRVGSTNTRFRYDGIDLRVRDVIPTAPGNFNLAWVNPSSSTSNIANITIRARGYANRDARTFVPDQEMSYIYTEAGAFRLVQFNGLEDDLYYDFYFDALLEDNTLIENVASFTRKLRFETQQSTQRSNNFNDIQVTARPDNRFNAFDIKWTNPSNPALDIRTVVINARGYSSEKGGTAIDDRSVGYYYNLFGSGDGKERKQRFRSLDRDLFYEFQFNAIANGRLVTNLGSSTNRHKFDLMGNLTNINVTVPSMPGNYNITWTNPASPSSPIRDIAIIATGYENATGGEVRNRQSFVRSYGINGEEQEEAFSKGLNASLFYDFSFDAILAAPYAGDRVAGIASTTQRSRFDFNNNITITRLIPFVTGSFFTDWVNPSGPEDDIKSIKVTATPFADNTTLTPSVGVLTKITPYEGDGRVGLAFFSATRDNTQKGVFYEFSYTAILEDENGSEIQIAPTSPRIRYELNGDLRNVRVSAQENGDFNIFWQNPEKPTDRISSIRIKVIGYADASTETISDSSVNVFYSYGINNMNRSVTIDASDLNRDLFYEFDFTAIIAGSARQEITDIAPTTARSRYSASLGSDSIDDLAVVSQQPGVFDLSWTNPTRPTRDISEIVVYAHEYADNETTTMSIDTQMNINYAGNTNEQSYEFTSLNNESYYAFSLGAKIAGGDEIIDVTAMTERFKFQVNSELSSAVSNVFVRPFSEGFSLEFVNSPDNSLGIANIIVTNNEYNASDASGVFQGIQGVTSAYSGAGSRDFRIFFGTTDTLFYQFNFSAELYDGNRIDNFLITPRFSYATDNIVLEAPKQINVTGKTYDMYTGYYTARGQDADRVEMMIFSESDNMNKGSSGDVPLLIIPGEAGVPLEEQLMTSDFYNHTFIVMVGYRGLVPGTSIRPCHDLATSFTICLPRHNKLSQFNPRQTAIDTIAVLDKLNKNEMIKVARTMQMPNTVFGFTDGFLNKTNIFTKSYGGTVLSYLAQQLKDVIDEDNNRNAPFRINYLGVDSGIDAHSKFISEGFQINMDRYFILDFYCNQNEFCRSNYASNLRNLPSWILNNAGQAAGGEPQLLTLTQGGIDSGSVSRRKILSSTLFSIWDFAWEAANESNKLIAPLIEVFDSLINNLIGGDNLPNIELDTDDWTDKQRSLMTNIIRDASSSDRSALQPRDINSLTPLLVLGEVNSAIIDFDLLMSKHLTLGADEDESLRRKWISRIGYLCSAYITRINDPDTQFIFNDIISKGGGGSTALWRYGSRIEHERLYGICKAAKEKLASLKAPSDVELKIEGLLLYSGDMNIRGSLDSQDEISRNFLVNNVTKNHFLLDLLRATRGGPQGYETTSNAFADFFRSGTIDASMLHEIQRDPFADVFPPVPKVPQGN